MKKYLLFAFLLPAFLFTACDNDDSDVVGESVPFYQKLGVEYNVTQNHTRVGANFNKNDSKGSNMKLGGNSSIRFNSITPKFLSVGEYFYTHSFNGLDNITFTFTRSKGNVFVNAASLNDINPIAIPDTFTTVFANGNTVLTWEGEPIGPNEYVQARIEFKGGINNIYNRNEGGKTITINFSNSAAAGKATLFLSRIKTFPLQQSNGDAGGRLDISYVKDKEITLQ